MKIKEITAFETEDGAQHMTLAQAELHAARSAALKVFNESDVYWREPDVDDILNAMQATKETRKIFRDWLHCAERVETETKETREG